ncbi:hypothetical protein X275_07690 [Marinitoga sp. 1197]|uniref:ROK family transcriptional regulator n=1 Tax=Marinitoga sp. 1197 TaxID=1428449 RepID=UPI000640BF22|nr:ROK family transcriptional regulator [Marinitoga sp. 1197]KLO21935.1 hypothetical protein X275_07690 [Marinitoga sp. 1197]
MVKITDSLIKVLNFIWKKEKTYLMEISKETGLEKSTVSRSLNKLKNLNLIKKVDELSASPLGGRKTSIYSFNFSIGYILGISIEQDGLEFVLTDLQGIIIFSKRKNIKIDKNNIVNEIISIYSQFDDYKILSVGISLPGIINSSNGIIVYSKALNIENLDLSTALEKEIDVPVFIENDSNCGAIFFNLKYKDKSHNILYFHISIPYFATDHVGLGIGIVIKNKLYHGSNNCAGEVEFKIPLINTNENISFTSILNEDIDTLINNSRDFINIYSKKLGDYISIFDPDNIIIGGNITLLNEKFLNIFIEEIKKNIFIPNIRKLHINHISPEDYLTSRGAVSIVLHKMFSNKRGTEHFLKIYLMKRGDIK